MSNDNSVSRAKRQRKELEINDNNVLSSSIPNLSSSSTSQQLRLSSTNGTEDFMNKNSSLMNKETEERSRERNRIHARKSRQRRKIFVEQLKSDLENCIYEANNLQTLYCQAYGNPYVSSSSSSSSNNNQSQNHNFDDNTTNIPEEEDEDDDSGTDDDSHLNDNNSTTNGNDDGTINNGGRSQILDREARCRERNRIHAKKSRQRKKLLVEQLKQRLMDKSNDITAMRTALSKYYGTPHHPDLLKILPSGPSFSSLNRYNNTDIDLSHSHIQQQYSTTNNNDGNNKGSTEPFLSLHTNSNKQTNNNNMDSTTNYMDDQDSNNGEEEYDEQTGNIRKSLSGRILRSRPAPLSPHIPQLVKGRGRGRPPKSLTSPSHSNNMNNNDMDYTNNMNTNHEEILDGKSVPHSSNTYPSNSSSNTNEYSNMYFSTINYPNDPLHHHHHHHNTTSTPYSMVSNNTTNMSSAYDSYYNSSHRKRSYQDSNLSESHSHNTNPQEYFPPENYYASSASNPSYTNNSNFSNSNPNSSVHSNHPNDYTNNSKHDYDTAERAHELHHNYRNTNNNNMNNNNHHHHDQSRNSGYPPSSSLSSSTLSGPSSGSSSGFEQFTKSHENVSTLPMPVKVGPLGGPAEPDLTDPYIVIPSLVPPNPLEFLLPDNKHIGAAYSKFLNSYRSYYDRELGPKLRYKYGTDGRNIPDCYKPDYYAPIEALILARAGMLPIYNNHTKSTNNNHHHSLPPLPPWKAHPLELYVRREYARQLSTRPEDSENHSLTPTSDSAGASSDARRQGETEQMSMEQKSNGTSETNRSDRSNDNDTESSNPDESTMTSPLDQGMEMSVPSKNSLSHKYRNTNDTNNNHHTSSHHKNFNNDMNNGNSINESPASSPTLSESGITQERQVAADLMLCMRNTNTNTGSLLSSSNNKLHSLSKSLQSEQSNISSHTNDSRLTVTSGSSSGQHGDDEDTASSSSSSLNTQTKSTSNPTSASTPTNNSNKTDYHHYHPTDTSNISMMKINNTQQNSLSDKLQSPDNTITTLHSKNNHHSTSTSSHSQPPSYVPSSSTSSGYRIDTHENPDTLALLTMRHTS